MQNIELIDNKGSKIALTGYANEHLVQLIVDQYKNTNDVNVIDKFTISQQQLNEKFNTTYAFDDDYFIDLIDGAKKAAFSIVDHIDAQYQSSIQQIFHVGSEPQKAKQITGRKTNADLILKTIKNSSVRIKRHPFIGTSLKASKGSSSNKLKLYAPSIQTLISIIEAHYTRLFGQTCNLSEALSAIAIDGVNQQKQALVKHHNTLIDVFGDDVIRFKYNNKCCKYSNGELSSGATSYIRDCKKEDLREIYNQMSVVNLQMKKQIAKVVSDVLTKIFDTNDRNITESLFRSFANVKTSSDIHLPTFITSVKKTADGEYQGTIYNIEKAIENYLSTANTITIKHNSTSIVIGPGNLTIDCRPTTCANPLSRPANFSVSNLWIEQYSNEKISSI